MENRTLSLILILLFFGYVCDLSGQCYVGKFRSNVEDSCNNINIYGRYKKAMNMMRHAKNINSIYIFKSRKPICLPSELLEMQLYSVHMWRCANDSIFLKMKDLGDLLYYSDTLKKEMIYATDLVNISIYFDKGNISHLTNDTNYVLRRLGLISKHEDKLDSSLLFFKKLEDISFCFNPFDQANYAICSNLDKLKNIHIRNMDFRVYKFNDFELERLQRYKVDFINCKFTKEQKKQISLHFNFTIF